MHDRETMQLVLDAAETGYLVLSSLNTVDASKAVDRIIGSFSVTEQPAIRVRLAKTFRYIVSQRLLPRKDGSGRVAAIEILKSNPSTRECVESGKFSSGELLEAMQGGLSEGMQFLDGEIEKLVRAGTVDLETALPHAVNPRDLENTLQSFKN
jgi:twitching motility protein PilT